MPSKRKPGAGRKRLFDDSSRITIRLSAARRQQLDAAAVGEKCETSEMLRRIIDRYFDVESQII